MRFVAVVSAGIRCPALAQVGPMVLVLAVGFAAPRLGLHPFYVLGGMFVGSATVASLAAEQTPLRIETPAAVGS